MTDSCSIASKGMGPRALGRPPWFRPKLSEKRTPSTEKRLVRPFWPAIETPRVLGLNEANGSRRAMSRISRDTEATLAMLSRSNTVTSGPLFSARAAVTTRASTCVSPTAIGRT